MKTKYLLLALVLMLALVLVFGCLCGCVDYYNRIALLAAIENEDVHKVEYLLEKGVDPNATDVKPSKFWVLLEHSPRLPLAVACDTGNLEIVTLLINYGATAEYNPKLGRSPLRQTLFYYHPDDVKIVSLLLENGAATIEDEEGSLAFAAAQMRPRIFDKSKANGTVFLDGYDEDTAKGITEIVCMLLREQDLNITTKSGKTLLMLSVQQENLYLANYLIEAGCNVSITDMSGRTALDYAVETKNDALIEIVMAG